MTGPIYISSEPHNHPVVVIALVLFYRKKKNETGRIENKAMVTQVAVEAYMPI